MNDIEDYANLSRSSVEDDWYRLTEDSDGSETPESVSLMVSTRDVYGVTLDYLSSPQLIKAWAALRICSPMIIPGDKTRISPLISFEAGNFEQQIHVQSALKSLERMRLDLVETALSNIASDATTASDVVSPMDVVKQFQPSVTLLNLCVAGSMAYQALSEKGYGQEWSSIGSSTEAYAGADFTSALLAVFAVVGFRQQNGLEDNSTISTDGKFTLAFQTYLNEYFPVVPYQLGLFFDRLHTELVEFLEAGGLMMGRWGSLCLSERTGTDLCLKVSDTTSFQESQWLKIIGEI